jgi:hypothetical protein
MATCSKCIIPDNFPKVEMNNGICSFCKINEQKFVHKLKISKDKELQSLLNGSNQNKYDCVVPISGGKDSTYILYYLVKNLNLTPLAVFFDNGFATDDAKNNVEDICKKLNVDLIIRHASVYRRKLIREAWYISFYREKLISLCGNCENNIRTVSINEALNHNIRYIIWGSTDYEDDASGLLNISTKKFRDRFSGSNNFIKSLTTFLKTIARIFIKEKISFLAKMMAFIHYLKYLHYYVIDNIKLKAPEGLKRYSPFLEVSFRNKKTETLYFYDYVPYDPFNQIKILEREIGWKAPSGREAKMDCELHYVSNFGDLKQTGITNSGFKLSVLVRNGMISRDEALKKEQREVEFLKNYFQSEKLEIKPVLHVMKDKIFMHNKNLNAKKNN